LSVAVRQQAGQRCFDLTDYRRRYAQYKTDPDLQRAHAAHAFFVSFDDHEVTDNWAGDHDEFQTPAELVRLRRAAAFQAWYEHMPVRRAQLPSWSAVNMYRGLRYGDLVAVDILDTRQYRTPAPCGTDFAPACPTLDDPKAQVISAEEEAWLVRNLNRRDARWNCIAQQIMMMSLDRRTADGGQPILNLDSWAGYEAPRRRILSRMKGLGNVVVLTGDEHQNYAGILHDRDTPVAVEFVGTSISSGGDGWVDKAGSDHVLAGNPQLKLVNDNRGYLTFDVSPDEWRTNFMIVDKVSIANGNVSKLTNASVERGRPDVRLG
jgi:alkaline phosphatase D